MSSPGKVSRQKAEARVGTTLHRKWHVDELIDIGGMASVYAATHRNGNRVAIKMLHPQLSSDGEIRERFLREGYAANKVDHPGAVTVLDDDEAEDGSVFLVMELLEGEPLANRLDRRGKLEPPEVLFIGDQILDVLASAHMRGVIHRDLKPANLFLTRDGGVKILDFGLARVRESTFEGDRTRDGIVIGTASFMAPEQAQGKNDQIDARSDLWAVGAVLFSSLTGRFVHDGKSMLERLMTAMKSPAPSLGQIAPNMPPSLIAYVDRALAFAKEDRFPDASSMQAAGRAVYQELTGQAIPGFARTSMVGAAWADQQPGHAVANDPTEIAVSVVFDPDAPEGSNSVIYDLQPKVTLEEDTVTDSMIAESPELVSPSMIEELPLEVRIGPPAKPRGNSK